MKKTWIRAALTMLLMLSLMLTSCVGAGFGNSDEYEDYNPNKKPGNDQFDFPGNYVAPELKIDGVNDDAQWANAKTVATFGHGGAATIKIYRGEQALFFFAEVADTILATEGETNDDAVTRSDSVEIYIDTLADGGLKPQNDDYQINLGIHGKTRIMQGSGSGWGGWNGLIDYEVQLNGVLNDGYEAVDTGYTVEIMIPYSQIGIEKDDTIAVSFGQVDKVASGASATIDWDWYGWTYNGKIVEPQTPDNYLLLDKDGNVMSRDEESKPDADMAGYVVDYVTGNPIAGATVTVTSPEGLGIESVVTDEQGYYVFEKVNPEMTYILSVEKENYFSNTVEYSRTELRDSNGGRVLKNVTLRNENDVEKTTVVGTVKNIVYGAVEGALVVVEGTTLSATTDANGIFTIEGVPAEESITLVVSHDFYGSSKTTVPVEMLVANGESNVGDVNINLPYAQTGGFGNKSDKFANSTMYLSRTLTGIEMILEGTRKLDGKIEVYLDVKECADNRDNDATMWRFDLDGNGTIAGVENYAAEGNGSAYGLEYELYYNDSTGYSARFFIPYTYLGIAPLDVFGISLGQWSTSATDWDGWGFNGQFIAPELPKQFVRVSATNELYRQDDNTSMVNLSGNVGMPGVKVEVNGISTVTGADGAWYMKAVKTSDAVNIVYSRQGYVSYTTTIPAGYFDRNDSYSEIVTLEKQTVTLSGIVTNDRTGAPVVDATVSISGTDISVPTDENGKYTITGLGTEVDVLLKVEAEGYAIKEESISAATLASQSSHTLNIALVESNNINYITLSGKITNVNGPVEGVRVSVVGNSELSVLTNANGEFAIENYPVVDCVIHIEKVGYISQDITMKADDIAKTAKEHSIGEIDFLLEYEMLHGVIADKDDRFAAFVGYVTRSNVGFEFKFVGSRAFTGQLELFVDTKASAGVDARDTSDYLFLLLADGGLSIVNWGDGVKNESRPANMVYTVENADTAPVLTFTLPYDFFGQRSANEAVAPTEVIGISAGQWMGTDWDGWDNFALLGANGEPFVKPEMPMDYIRIGAHNEIYSHINNDTLNLNEYQINFGTGYNAENNIVGARPVMIADNFYAKVVSRDANGVTFSFLTTGDFAKEGDQNEMVLVYFDKGESTGGWTNDYLIKIASDGTVYGRAGAWWSATEADKLGTVTITRENGVTRFDLTVSYETIGVAADEVFGVAMRECSHNAVDHHLYDPWWDCYFNRGTDIGSPVTGIDAANCAAYIRVAADGTLYLAPNNQ
ncbi:MAG: carboxypeptidase regulatory-like domain-containing protein [Clostridia bacterium]|nr:carboxypeptidase regulatory-like domain-containing protein [Clostridia bacterium]